MVQRDVKILEILESNNCIKINLLAEMLDISQVTLRKDLDNLEKRGIIRRNHGYVDLNGAHEVGKRIAFCYPIKRRIAKAAAQLINENETVMIESGSCCALFAEELALSRKNVTIITNSVFISAFLCHFPQVKIILLGGFFQPDSQMVIGPMTVNCAGNFYLDKLFIGASGFIPGNGFTSDDHLCAETAAGLINSVKKVFVLTEASKFSRSGTYRLVQLDKVAGVFTDDSIPQEAENSLLENKIQLHKVPSVKVNNESSGEVIMR